MAKPKKYNLYSRLFLAEKKLGEAQKKGKAKEIDALKARIDNIHAMLEEDYDYGKFSSGGLLTKGKLAKKYVNPVTIVNNLKKKP